MTLLEQMSREQLKYNYAVHSIQSMMNKTTPMQEDIRLTTEALNEIRHLRRQNELMSARLDMWDSMMTLLHSQPPNRSVGMIHPDLVNQLEEYINARNLTEKTLVDNGVQQSQFEDYFSRGTDPRKP